MCGVDAVGKEIGGDGGKAGANAGEDGGGLSADEPRVFVTKFFKPCADAQTETRTQDADADGRFGP